MSQEEIPSVGKALVELFNESFLLIPVKIDHHVPAEYRVQSDQSVIMLEIVVIKDHEFFHMRLYPIVAFHLIKVGLQVFRADGLCLVFTVEALLRAVEDSQAYV